MGVSDQGPGGTSALPARWLGGIFFLALGLRLVAWAELRDSPWIAVPLGDARAFDEWGVRISGDWRPREVFYQAPLYPYFLGSVYALVGHSLAAVRAIQCVLGALAAVWIAAGTQRLAGVRAARIAGFVAAAYVPAMAYDLQVEKSSLAFSLSALLFYLTLARCDPARRGGPFSAGLALGALTLLRENAAILLLPLAVFLARGSGARGRALAAAAAGFTLVLLPAAVSNLRLGGVPLPTAANAGVNFYIGNGAEADGMYRPLVAGRGHPDHEREDAARIAREIGGKELSPAGVSLFWFEQAWSEIRAEPRHFVARIATKCRLLAHQREIMDAVALEVFQDGSRLLRWLGVLSFGVLLPLAAVGARRAPHRRRAGFALGSAICLALSIVAFFVVGRFRLGLVPFLVPFVPLGLLGWREDRRRALSLAVLAAAAALCWWPLAPPGDARATSAANLASELLRRGDPAGAEVWAREARARDPRSADAAFNLGVVLRARGRHAEAVEPFEAAARLEPAYEADCLAELGAIRAVLGDEHGARSLLERALEIAPDHAEARRYLETLRRRSAERSSD